MKNWKTLLLGIAMIANTSFAAPQVVDKVAAVVNNGVVLESDVDGLLQSVKLNAGQAGQQLPDDATLRHQILERLIMDQIVLQMGQKMGMKITDDQVDQAIANIAKQNNMTMDQMRSRLGDWRSVRAYPFLPDWRHLTGELPRLPGTEQRAVHRRFLAGSGGCAGSGRLRPYYQNCSRSG